jgi:GNAT superfamily N-acetyltransferase
MMRTIRTLTLAEVETLIGWAGVEGWNPGLDDAAAFHVADPQGFFGAFVDDQMVAGISAVAYDRSYGFIGLYICHPAWRGQGHGKAVWDAAMAYLGTRTIGLDAVPEQRANYATMGFAAAHDTVRMTSDRNTRTVGHIAVDAAPEDRGAIVSLDRMCFPAPREAFLDIWIAPPHRVVVTRNGGTISGFAVSRRCLIGSKIGPVLADSVEAALAMIASLASDAPISIDVPTNQTELLDRLAGLGYAPGFATTRTYRGPAPILDQHRLFGITSLELG